MNLCCIILGVYIWDIILVSLLSISFYWNFFILMKLVLLNKFNIIMFYCILIYKKICFFYNNSYKSKC